METADHHALERAEAVAAPAIPDFAIICRVFDGRPGFEIQPWCAVAAACRMIVPARPVEAGSDLR